MKLKDLMKAMQAIEEDRSLSVEVVTSALKEALTKAYRKHVEMPDALVEVEVNEHDGEIKVFRQKTVVENVEDDEFEISLEEAKELKADAQIGDTISTNEINIADFGRAAVILAKNVLRQKIKEAEKQAVYDEYIDKLQDMVVGTIESVEEKFCVVNIGKTLALMPRVAQIPGEVYKEGQRIRVVISEVNKETKGAQVLVSRADANLVRRLFEKEVPEIYQGIVEIKEIAREPGERCKMAVYSKNENVDPIGACIGPRGSRVQVIIDELHGEKIDIFEWSEDVSELIKNALSPAQILAVIPNPEKKGLLVVVSDSQLSLAIGKKGKNARLAVKLTNSKIDIKAESEVEAMGIDYRAIYAKQQEELQARLAEKRALEQQKYFEERKASENSDEFDEELFEEIEYDDIHEDEAIDTVTAEEKEAEAPVEKIEEEPAKEREETNLERAARIAKEKKAKEGIDLASKQEYVSKFESIAGVTSKPQAPAPKKKKNKEKNEEEEILRKPTFDLKKDYEMKPIYSEEELEEIAKREAEERENDWINDDIDFDEFDEYYD
ncbi:transcription termination factor NusA [Traorella massiliensis]|uniref:transcription termination factor NusA n=1 Tax=Traorella massiliensis TaxID=1903263 RepID=UPI0008F95C0C|nr:transcription termination factor NusA [Traorella massiliensis]